MEYRKGEEIQNQSRIKNIFQNEFRRVFGMEIKLTFQFSTTNDKRWRKRKFKKMRFIGKIKDWLFVSTLRIPLCWRKTSIFRFLFFFWNSPWNSITAYCNTSNYPLFAYLYLRQTNFHRWNIVQRTNGLGLKIKSTKYHRVLSISEY